MQFQNTWQHSTKSKAITNVEIRFGRFTFFRWYVRRNKSVKELTLLNFIIIF